jgi:EAL domain-containing protein (putative c-di-GMP-specific phosphodiesterase class I)
MSFMNAAHALRLMQAYSKIKNRQVQHKTIVAHQPRYSHTNGPGAALEALVRFTSGKKSLDAADGGLRIR